MRVAVAGGTGTIGSSIVSALASSGRHTPVILSRSVPSTTTNPTVETRVVDYSSHESLVNALRDIDAVISALLIPGPEFVTYQLNLLHAAEEAKCKRFAPSEWALSYESHKIVSIDRAKIIVWDAVKESVSQGKIDAALFPCGMFMNYLGIGAPKEEEARAGFREGPMVFHLDDKKTGPWVEIPVNDEDGSFPSVTMTDIRDVGKFVAAALDMDEPWGGRELGMAGETVNLADIVELCKKYVSKDIQVKTVSVSELQRKIDSLDPSDILARVELEYPMVCGRGGSVVKATLNELCPEVKPTRIEDFLKKYWAA